MGDGSRGTDGIAFLYGNMGRSQAHNQIGNQLGKIPRALLVTKSNAAKLFVLDPRQPVFNNIRPVERCKIPSTLSCGVAVHESSCRNPRREKAPFAGLGGSGATCFRRESLVTEHPRLRASASGVVSQGLSQLGGNLFDG
jgi:hypothetical protein